MKGARYYFACAAAALLLVALGHFLVIPRDGARPEPALAITQDAKRYAAMVEHGTQAAGVPFRYRPLVPALARRLGLPPYPALRAVTYASLAVTYFIALLLCREAGASFPAALAGLFMVFSSAFHLYNYHNPFLTDGFGLMALFLMAYFFERGWLVPFVGAAGVGVLARESTLFLAPLWLARREWIKAAGAILVALAVYAAARTLIPSGEDGLAGYLAKPARLDRFQTPLAIFASAVFSWKSPWWSLAAFSAALAPARRFPGQAWAFTLLFAGASVSCLFAGDIGRMYSILTPCLTVWAAALFDAVTPRSRVLAAALIAIALAQLFTSMPTVVGGPESWLLKSEFLQFATFGAGLAWCGAAAALLWKPLVVGLSEKRDLFAAGLKELRLWFTGRAGKAELKERP